MLIDFREISPTGLDVASAEEITWFGDEPDDPLRELYRFPQPFDVRVHLDKTAENVFMAGTFSGTIEARCVRCLKSFALPVSERLRLTLMPSASVAAGNEGEKELEAEDLDLAYYEAERLDLGRVVSEHVLLLLDLYPHCRPDCKGLCPECGTDMNEAACSCADNRVDSRFAALQKFKPR
jgi:uncharacterized protein